MKKSLLVIVSLTAVIALSGFAMAAGPYGPGSGRGMRGGGPGFYQQLTPEQQAEWQKKRADFMSATLEQRKALATKMVEYRTLRSQANPDQAKIKALASELVELRSQIAKKRIEILGDSFQGRGFGRGGYGHGYGRGMGGYGGGPGMGGGYGSCWR